MATADREAPDRGPEPRRDATAPALPNARLNPLLNPLLAKHLGRWAHIYYTASVDKRETAIEALVCELEAEEAQLAGAASAAAATGFRDAFLPASVAPRVPGPVLVTAQEPEPLAPEPPRMESRWNETLLGETLVGDTFAAEAAAVEHPSRVFPGTAAQSTEPQAVPPPLPRLPVDPAERHDSVPESWRELLRRTGSEPPADSYRSSPVGNALDSDTWPTLPSNTGPQPAASAAWANDPSPRLDAIRPSALSALSSLGWRRPLIAGGVVAVLGASLWVARMHRSGPDAPEQGRAPQKPVVPTAVVPTASAPTNHAPTPTPTAASTPAFSRDPNAPANPSVLLAKTPAPADSQPTDPDLEAGMRALQGTGVPRDSAEAARHLWQSVKNQNGSALIVLASLYAQGDGVAKDCDQARVLLDAAARKAKSHSQFQRVEVTRSTLRTAGCE